MCALTTRAASWGSVDSNLTSIRRLLGTRFTLRLSRNSVPGTAECSHFRGLIRCAWLRHKSAACERWRSQRGSPPRAKKKELTTGACAESVDSRRGEAPAERAPRLAIARGRASGRWHHSNHFHEARVCFLQPFSSDTQFGRVPLRLPARVRIPELYTSPVSRHYPAHTKCRWPGVAHLRSYAPALS